MRIISHRGLWLEAGERNSLSALCRSLEEGFGFETDLRDHDGRLVVSHDPPGAGSAPPSAAELFGLWPAGSPPAVPLALNIKADGLQPLVADAIASSGLRDYFLFDLSVPDARSYLEAGLRVFTRQSEWEREPAFYEPAAGVWIDAFFEEWFDAGTIRSHRERGKAVGIVSPELHGRDPAALWELLRQAPEAQGDEVMLCTDRPREARELFHGR